MNASKILSAVAVALMAVAGAAHAETYEGVHQLTSAASRAEVASQAVVAAHSANPYATGANAGPAQVFVSSNSRDTVRAGAVVAARSADPYAEGASAGVAPIVASTVDRATVRAAARAAARGDSLPL
ncbi:helicase SNF2 [Variovorax paradoxus]|uniref:Helicase SNF2 n=1 Tax=Variovorax paradoxus TaxID=34073 RepID=A0A6I6HCY8_VARPD|nr:helicase SNF2 [Variovorax paradoxus]QGW80464.1 helicase SNF2 [Variovorax paradoxus]